MQQSNAIPRDRIWCAIPVFNNRDTVRKIAEDCRAILRHVVVIDDGSTDVDVASLLSGVDVVVLRHETNLGKGQATVYTCNCTEEYVRINR